MKVLVLNQFASTPQYSSGAGERFFYLSKYLKKEYSVDVTTVSASFNHLFLRSPKVNGLFTEEILPEGGSYVWVKVRKYSASSFLFRVLNLFEFAIKLFLLPKRIVSSADVVVVSSMSIFPIFYGLYLKLAKRKKLILEIRDIWPLTPIEIGGFSRYNPYILLLGFTAKLGYKFSDEIVSVLPDFDKFLSREVNIKKSFTWIPNGIDVLEGDSTPKVESKMHKGKFVVMYTGALGDANALHVLIQVASTFSVTDNIEFVIVGNGPKKEELVEAASDISFISFMDKIPKSEVANLLVEADCCYHGCRDLNLYQYGISPNKINDYFLSGKPVISASPSFSDPVLLSGGGIHTKAESVDQIRKAILSLKARSTEERDELGMKGYEYVRRVFNYKSLAEQYYRVLIR